MSVIPVLAGGGTVFLDRRAHKTIYDGCQTARARGAEIVRFGPDGPDELEALLRAGTWRRPGLICIDGVNSMTGNLPELSEYAALARSHDVLLYVDDAHGFGVIGERSPLEPCDYGVRGNSVVRHLGESYDNIVLVGGFSKAYSSLLAFIACPTPLKQVLKTAAPPYLYSGPSPVASLATVLEGLRVNAERGDALRAELARLTGRVLHRVHELGITTPNRSGLPIIEIPVADADRIDDVGNLLFDRGIYVTMAVYPLVPRGEVGFRLQLTAANTDEQVDHLCDVLGEVASEFRLSAASCDRPASDRPTSGSTAGA
jgi:8-amino-7-oxononanoate synthase